MYRTRHALARFATSVTILSACLGDIAEAQSRSVNSTSQIRAAKLFDSRAELEREAASAEAGGRKSAAWLLRTRLLRGDFQEGDRIILVMDANPLPDTLQVRAPKVLQFAGIEDLSLEGVLRSELNDAIRTHLGRYLRNPGVRSTPLVPIAILGSVGAPGYYYTPADAVIRDLIMRAGGLQSAALDKAVVRRSGEVIWSSVDFRVALADGVSVDQMHLRAGDEIFIPEQRRTNLATILTVTSSTAALLVTVIQISRR